MEGLTLKLLMVSVWLLAIVLVCIATVLVRLLRAVLGGTEGGHWRVDVVASAFVDKRLTGGDDWEPVGAFVQPGSLEPMIVVRRWVTADEVEDGRTTAE